MKKSYFHLPLAVIALLAFLITLSSALSPGVRGCHKINAKGEGAVTGQFGNITITEADIIGGGLLHGTTRAEFTFQSPTSFTGPLVLTTKHGTLEFYITEGFFGGTEFSATAMAVEGSGTGKLTGAEGTLVLESVQVNPDGSFTETITGEICLD